MELLKRKIDKYLLDWKNTPQRKPLIVKGARQIGKTESIRAFGEANYESVIEINFVLQKKFRAIFDDGYEVETIIKNISLLYDKDIRSCRLAPAYDMLSTSIYEMSTDNMAFSIGGDMSIADITRDSFGREARMVGINEAAAYRQFDRMAKGFVKALDASADELTRAGFANAEEIKERILETGGISRL